VALAGGEVVVDVPAGLLTDGAPPGHVPIDPAPAPEPLDLARVPEPEDLAGAWLALLAAPSTASKRWVYERYDHLVGASTVRRPGGDAAVVRLPGSRRAIALTTDGADRHCQLDPRAGGRAVVCEAARNLACTGARPLAATDCLNFGNPEKGATGWRLREVIGGIADACRALGVPVVSGNVSLYNESPGRVIFPTPVVGMVGLIEDAARSVPHAFAEEGDVVFIAGAGEPRLDASEHLGAAEGLPPAPDLAAEGRLCAFLVDAAAEGLPRSAHDVSGGGLAVALAESAIAGGLGARVEIEAGRRADEALFGECGGRALVTCRPADRGRLEELAAAAGVPLRPIGTVGGDAVDVSVGGRPVRIALADAAGAYEGAIPGALG
jgi:phosphoribosylformylglycinamidine synthase